jgi:transcription elongation factor Elf1
MAKGDSVIVTCPKCGSSTSAEITMTDGGQVVTCKNCSKNFMMDVSHGEFRRVRA